MLDPIKAREAKAALAAKLEAIAALYVPDGYTVEHRESLSGRHYGKRKLIQAPRPRTPAALYIFLHECAHAHLGHAHNGRAPRHVEEMEAEMWAHAKMEEHGVPVPAEQTRRAKRYVARKVHQAKVRGAKNIDPRAVAFAGDAMDGIHGWQWVRNQCVAKVTKGRYVLTPEGDGWGVWWHPRRGGPEKVGRASTLGKAGKQALADHRYRSAAT